MRVQAAQRDIEREGGGGRDIEHRCENEQGYCEPAVGAWIRSAEASLSVAGKGLLMNNAKLIRVARQRAEDNGASGTHVRATLANVTSVIPDYR